MVSDTTKLKKARAENKELQTRFDNLQAQVTQLLQMQAQIPAAATNPPAAATNPTAAATNPAAAAPAAAPAAPNVNGMSEAQLVATNPNNVFTLERMKRDAAKKASASAGKEDPVVVMLRGKIRTKVWRRVKFVKNKKSHKKKFAMECLDALNLTGLDGKTPESNKLRKIWVDTHTESCIKALNEARGYVLAQLRKAYEANGCDNIISEERIMKCLTRDLDFSKKKVDGEEVWNSPQDVQDFLWYVDNLMPKATANGKDWDEGKRYYMTISHGHAPNHHNHFYITPGTEAFAVLCLEGCRERWQAIDRVKKENNATKYQHCIYDLDDTKVHEEKVSEFG